MFDAVEEIRICVRIFNDTVPKTCYIGSQRRVICKNRAQIGLQCEWLRAYLYIWPTKCRLSRIWSNSCGCQVGSWMLPRLRAPSETRDSRYLHVEPGTFLEKNQYTSFITKIWPWDVENDCYGAGLSATPAKLYLTSPGRHSEDRLTTPVMNRIWVISKILLVKCGWIVTEYGIFWRSLSANLTMSIREVLKMRKAWNCFASYLG